MKIKKKTVNSHIPSSYRAWHVTKYWTAGHNQISLMQPFFKSVHGHVASRWRKLIMLKYSTWTNESLCRSSGTVNTVQAARYCQSPHGCGRHYGTSRFVRIRPMKHEQLLPSLVTNGWHTGESQRVPLFCVIKHWKASITERVAVTAYFCQHKAHSRQELLTTREVVGHLRFFCKSHSWNCTNFRLFLLRQTSVIRHFSAVVCRQTFLYSEPC